MSRYWRWLLPLGYLLLATNALVTVLYAIVWCKATDWKWRDGILTFRAQRPLLFGAEAQGASWVLGFDNEHVRENASTRVHENCHVVQEMVCALIAMPFIVVLFATGHPVLGGIAIPTAGGLLFALLYLLTFFAGWAARGFKDWQQAYLSIPFEQQARSKAALYKLMPSWMQAKVWGHW